MTTLKPSRIKSAAFIRRRVWPEENDFLPKESLHREISSLPISESRYTIRPNEKEKNIRKTSSLSRIVSTRAGQSISSELWRQVHSTRSEFRLRSLSRGIEQEPVRINLLQKVDRIKSKHKQKQSVYQRCINAIAIKSLERSRIVKSQGSREGLDKKIMQLLVPFEEEKIQAEDRYRARLLKIRNF